jgi:hypothetical protein
MLPKTKAAGFRDSKPSVRDVAADWLPLRLYDLVAQLRRTTKEHDYRHNAGELMRFAEHAQSPAEKNAC